MTAPKKAGSLPDEFVTQEKTPREWYELGARLRAEGDLVDAAVVLDEAIRLDPAFEKPYIELAHIMLKTANVEKALYYLHQAVLAASDNLACKEEFLRLVEDKDFIHFSPLTKEMIVICLRSDKICYERLRKIWLNYTKIDPSRPRLAYAELKTGKYGNIDFLQGDLESLSGWRRKFDLVISMIALCHMESPESGWSILSDMVLDGGYMRINLYSEQGRQYVFNARKAIAENGYTSEIEDIRKFRRECPGLLKKRAWEKLQKTEEYYTLPGCRKIPASANAA